MNNEAARAGARRARYEFARGVRTGREIFPNLYDAVAMGARAARNWYRREVALTDAAAGCACEYCAAKDAWWREYLAGADAALAAVERRLEGRVR